MDPAVIRTVGEPGFARPDLVLDAHRLDSRTPLTPGRPAPRDGIRYPQQRVRVRRHHRVRQGVGTSVQSYGLEQRPSIEVVRRLVTLDEQPLRTGCGVPHHSGQTQSARGSVIAIGPIETDLQVEPGQEI